MSQYQLIKVDSVQWNYQLPVISERKVRYGKQSVDNDF
jgi:hypothetical protein